ncbi:hypothetical protein [Catenulispora acidiphila]|uniref:hypothetical protein n=1 Tax=Catenulispora acidiphila TaxID=304895 RepID=UPI00032600B0|nr:hypothetical protein [Catenulispora acidiphila]
MAFLSGAGVSVEMPTGLPSGAALTRRVCEAFFPERTFDTLLDYHAAVGWTITEVCAAQRARAGGIAPKGRLPRLETVLGVAMRVLDHDERRVLRILDDVRTAVPNRQHAALAAHLAVGGRQLTLNFDDCIEQRLITLEAPPDAADRLIHLHSSFRADPEGRSLGLTLARIEPGFQKPVEHSLTSTLAAAAAIVVVGYSGSDFFDVDQTVAALPSGSLKGTRLYWINHGSHPRWHVIDAANPALPPVIAGLARAGARPTVLCGRTGEFLSSLLDAWRLNSGPEPAVSAGPPAPPPTVPVSENERREAALALYRELAIPRAVAGILDSGNLAGLPSDAVWLARSELLWEQGRWNDLLHQWLRRTPEGIDPLVRAERVGACLWVQGRLVPAYLWLVAHRRAAAVDPDGARRLAETEGRVVEHMARTPELRPIARCLAPQAVGRIRALGGLEQQAGVHAFRRRQDLTSSLDAIGGGGVREAGHAAASQNWFAEAGSLTAALSYRHRQLRDEFRPDRPDEELAADYRELADRFDIVGSAAGRVRTCLLPGAERVFGVREFVSALFDGQFGWWHRCRLLGHYLPSRVGHIARSALTIRQGRDPRL